MAGVVRGSNQYLLDTDRDPAVEIDRNYGLKNDIHVTGNWQGKGDFAGVVRAGHPDGLLRWYLDTNGDQNHDIEIAFGLPGDIPVVGDWNGDGRDDVGVVRRGGDGFGDHYAPVAAVTSTGKVVVAWNFTGLGSKNRIYFRMIDPNGATTITKMEQANGPDSDTDDIRNA
jgi:hypothetical protein